MGGQRDEEGRVWKRRDCRAVGCLFLVYTFKKHLLSRLITIAVARLELLVRDNDKIRIILAINPQFLDNKCDLARRKYVNFASSDADKHSSR
jgi:hypothetical protein